MSPLTTALLAALFLLPTLAVVGARISLTTGWLEDVVHARRSTGRMKV